MLCGIVIFQPLASRFSKTLYIYRHYNDLMLIRSPAETNFYKFWWDVEATELKMKSIDAHKPSGMQRVGFIAVMFSLRCVASKPCINRALTVFAIVMLM